MSKNFFDLTQVGKNQIEANKKYEKQANDYLDGYYKNLRESTAAEEAKINEAALSSARLGYATTLERSKARVRNLQETIEYENKASIVGMTEMISQIVEKALLLDEEEYAAINPDFREDIRDTVAGLLKEADINEEITNKDTLRIMEFVAKTLPETKEGKYLTEDNLAALIRSEQTEDINGALGKFAGDVSRKVAVLMEKEQKKVKDIQKDQAKAGVPQEQPQQEMPPVNPDEVANAIANGQMAPEELDALVQQGQISPEDAQNIMAMVQGQQPAPQGQPQDPNAMAQDPNAQGMPMDQGAMGGQPMPKKQIQMLPDGTMNVNIFESIQMSSDEDDYNYLCEAMKFDLEKESNRELKRNTKALSAGIGATTGVEVGSVAQLAGVPGGSLIGLGLGALIGALVGHGVANARFKEDKDKVVSVIRNDSEAMTLARKIQEDIQRKDKKAFKVHKAAFLIRAREVQKQYFKDKKAEKASGERRAALAETFVRETPRCGLFESLAVNEATSMIKEGKEYDPDLCLANAIMYVTITETMNAMGLMNIDDRAYNKVIAHAGGNSLVEGSYSKQLAAQQKVEKTAMAQKQKADLQAAKKTETIQKQSLTETVIATQFVPQLANQRKPEDLAERIRAKRLLESYVDPEDQGEDDGFFQLSEDVLNEGLKSSLTLALVKRLPEPAVDRAFDKAIRKLEKKKPANYELYIKTLEEEKGKSLEEKKDFIRQCIQVSDPKKVNEADKLIRDTMSSNEKAAARAESLTEATLGDFAKYSVASGIGAGVSAGLVALGGAMGNAFMIPVFILIGIAAAFLIAGIPALIVDNQLNP